MLKNPVMQNPEINNVSHHGLVRSAGYAAVTVALILVILKFAAYFATHSVSMLASLIDSLLDVAASFVNLIAIRHALVPADKEHRFGHGKAEPLAGLAQSAFIAGSALFLIMESGERLFHPHEIEHGMLGLTVMIISTVLTIVLVLYQKYVINRAHSIAIKADSLHYLGDVLVNFSVIAALVISLFFGWPVADPLFALAVAAYVIYNAWEIAKASLDQLMDRELPDADRERIRQIALAHARVKGVHELRSRTSGRDIFIQLHLQMDRELDLETAHKIAQEVEKNICDAYPNADVIIHEDPDTEIYD
jgi:ferrous-iron efflux pump FieF